MATEGTELGVPVVDPGGRGFAEPLHKKLDGKCGLSGRGGQVRLAKEFVG